MSTRPRMSEPRMSPAAPGLRAMASVAALTAFPWPSAPRPAANASAKPAVMIDQRIISLFVPAAAAGSCANTGANAPAARTNTHVRTLRLLTTQASSRSKRQNPSSGRRGRLVPVRRVMSVLVVLVLDGDGPLQVDDGQQHEDERLQAARDEPEEHH